MKDLPLWRSPRAGVLGAVLMALPMAVLSASPLAGGYLAAAVLFIWPAAVCVAGLVSGGLSLLLGAGAALLAMGRTFGQNGLLLATVYLIPILAVFVYVILRRVPFRRGCFFLIGAHVIALAAVYWLLQEMAGGDLYTRAGELAVEGLQAWPLGDTLLYNFYEMGLLELPAKLAEGALVAVPGGYTLSDAARQDLLLSAKALVTSLLASMVPGVIARQSILGGVGCLLLPLRLGFVAQERREFPGSTPPAETPAQGEEKEKAFVHFPDLGMPPFRTWHLPRGMGWQAGLALVGGYFLQVSETPAVAVAGAILYAAAGAVWAIQGAALINYTQHLRGTRRFWRILIPLLLLSTSLLLIVGVFDQITNARGLRKPPEPKEES